MTDKMQNDIALFRYSVIAPLIQRQVDGDHPYTYFRHAANKEYIYVDGSKTKVSETSIARWYELYTENGFDGLKPQHRCDNNTSRKLNKELENEIIFLVNEYPRLPATQIYAKLISNGVISKTSISLSTITRYVTALKKKNGYVPKVERRRYEREHINEVWCGDSSHGPYISVDGIKRKVYIIALIDDASRMITGIDVFFEDNFVNLMKVIKSAVTKYGKPKVFNFDNGANYKSMQMQLLSARIGSAVHYCHPYSPEEKSKIERYFRTLKDQWMSTIKSSDYHSLEEIRASLMAWVNKYNATPHSALDGKAPHNRFFEESEYILRLSEEEIERSFLLEVDRKVSTDNVIVIDEKKYELESYKYQGQKVKIRYSPDLEKLYVVDEFDGTLHQIKILDKTANASKKRSRVSFTDGKDVDQ